MGRTIWFARHCEPESPGARICLGRRNDPALSETGARQAEALAARVAPLPFDRIYASPLARSRETAEAIAHSRGFESPLIREDLAETDMGEWDGLAWSEIRAHYPALYEARGSDASLTPPGAESCAAAAGRYERALLNTEGNCLVVGHRGAFGSLLCLLRGLPYSQVRATAIPYSTLFRLTEEDGTLHLHPTADQISALLAKQGTPEHVISHCQAVSELAVEIASGLNRAGMLLDTEQVRTAALLHDLARTEHAHAQRGADMLEAEGYPLLASVVRVHHDAALQTDRPDEAAVVFFADKLVAGTQRATLEERFARSAAKCTTAEAREKHAALLETSIALRDSIARITGITYE